MIALAVAREHSPTPAEVVDRNGSLQPISPLCRPAQADGDESHVVRPPVANLLPPGCADLSAAPPGLFPLLEQVGRSLP